MLGICGIRKVYNYYFRLIGTKGSCKLLRRGQKNIQSNLIHYFKNITE